MLVPVQTSGEKPPLFFVHGLHGVMPLGRIFANGTGRGIWGSLDDSRKHSPLVADFINTIDP